MAVRVSVPIRTLSIGSMMGDWGTAVPTYEVAHFREQNQDIIVVPLDRSFSARSDLERQQVLGWLQRCASGAGLAGTVVPVWDAGGGRMGFLAPTPWHPFFSSWSLLDVQRNLNKRLSCS
jgi:hypothetical protein